MSLSIGVVGFLTVWVGVGYWTVNRKNRAGIASYMERVEYVQSKWGNQLPWTYPQVGPDPRGPVPMTTDLYFFKI